MKTRLLLLLLTLSLIFTASCNQGNPPDTSETTTAKKYTPEEIDKIFGPGKIYGGGPDACISFYEDWYNLALEYDKLDVTENFINYKAIQSLGNFKNFDFFFRSVYVYTLNCDHCEDTLIAVWHRSNSTDADLYCNQVLEIDPEEHITETEKAGANLLVWESPNHTQIIYPIAQTPDYTVRFFYKEGHLWYAVGIILGETVVKICFDDFEIVSACPTHSKYFNESTAADAWNELAQSILGTPEG